MNVNLIDILKNAVTDKAIEVLGKQAGITPASAKSGIDAIIPSVLGGLLGKNTAASQAPDWLNVVSGLFNDKDENIQLDKFDLPGIAGMGKGLLGNLFGSNEADVTGAIAQVAGIQKEKAGGLLATVAPLALGYLTNWMKKKGWSFGDLIGNLLQQKSSLAAALPLGFSVNKLFDFGTPKVNIETPKVEVPKFEAPKIEAPKIEAPKVSPLTCGTSENKKCNWWKWLIWALVIALLLWLLLNKGCKSCGNKEAKPIDSVAAVVLDTLKADVGNTVATITGKLNEAGDWVYDLGESFKRKLADGVELSLFKNSVENRLVDFIEDANKAVDKTTWFSFDRLYFETGKSVLKPESQEQLKNIVAIMKAYPNVKIKLGGYTDNTGAEDVNMKISTERANAAKDALAKLGVDATRMAAEGYGPKHPIATNDTPEGRAQNRRIDIRVTAK